MRRLLLAIVLAGCGGDDGGPAGDPDADPASPWRDAPAVGGGAVQETAAVALDGRIYVIGGFHATDGVTTAVRVFDTASSEWSDGEPLPAAVHHANAAVVDGVIYVLGHLRTLAFTAHGDVWAWDPLTDAGWQVRAAMPAGTERGSSVVGVLDGRIVVAGGLRGGAAVADVSSYDPAADAWDDALADLPAPRDHACGGVVGGALVIAGGRQGAIESTSDAVWRLDASAWTARAPMITGRGGTACGVVGDRLIVVGGEGNPAATSGVFPQTEAYDPAADTWTSLDPMPTPRHGMGAAAWGGSLHVPGGATVQGFGAVDVHEVLTP
jgi:N-acetylneuraminic acid mutarotase